MRFESALRIALTFYATLVSFGLRHILDISADDPRTIGNYKWYFFFSALFLFSRFLLGAANHLWVEHIWRNRDLEHEIPKPAYFFFGLDLGFITMFGCFATLLAYLKTANEIFLVAIVFLLVVIGWGFLDQILRDYRKFKSALDWGFWLKINCFHLVFIAVAWALQLQDSLKPAAWIILTVASTVSLVWDCAAQLQCLGALPVEKPKSQTA
jgi:hypothetical protein